MRRYNPLIGPQVRDAVQEVTDADGVTYDYVDASVSSLTRSIPPPRVVPAWRATDVRVHAFYSEFGRPLEQLARVIAGMPGCRGTEILTDHPTLRPQVVGLFRHVAS